jgi:predicted TPR repeat methyltransferase
LAPDSAKAQETVEKQELPYHEALNFASQLHRDRHIEPAERLYRALLEVRPDDANAMHFLGVLLCQSGRFEQGLSSIQRSLEIDPGVAAWHNNLGNVMLDAGRIEEASQAYQRCLALDPEHGEVLNNLGVMQRSLGRLADAEATLLRAAARNPNFPGVHYNLASLCFDQKRFDEGYEHSARALGLDSRHDATRRILGLVLARLGRKEEAAQIFREWLELEPDSEQARHYLAGCTGEQVPERASLRYVEEVFDRFASSFDAKLEALDYRAPRLVGDAVGRSCAGGGASLAVLDAGCGTGLCAPWLAPFAHRLVGVDLSQAMLDRAAARGCYDELVKADLVSYLHSQARSYDLIVSADTLCYFGRLDEAVQGAARALRRDGAFCFTVEAHEDGAQPFRLHPHGRYSHHSSYLTATLRDAGFDEPDLSAVVLRQECGSPVAGWLVWARYPAG